ncbi:alpha-tocopherol transfer protein-like isoform X1 [Homalodisca vitripennis]|uniref:alpha-tocopherol transfer protein-like isoform X1 n=1 Tax=Homalodisca vitripennis TaxID=197043 RepID=UPI001EEC4DED|nr:alpha-tocopherol transfer protein-like isoform X1 [Homalodisca vitripennis]
MPVLPDPDPILSQCPLTENSAVRDMRTEPVTAEEEYERNPGLKKEDIAELRSWMKSQPHLPIVNDEQLILFHHSCYFNLEATKSCIEVYYTTRTNTPEFFQNRDLSRPELQKALEVLHYACLPVKDPNGYQIIFHRLHQTEPRQYVFNDGVKLLSMAIDACLQAEGTVPGYIFLFDMKGVRLGHLTRLSISSLKKFFLYIQEGMPVRLKAIHILNTQPVIDKIMMLIKPFMKKELTQLIHFHRENDMEAVYKVLPRSCLPKDFGGDQSSCEDLHVDYCQWMQKLQSHFKIEEEYRVDERKRITRKGSRKGSIEPEPDLRTLEID